MRTNIFNLIAVSVVLLSGIVSACTETEKENQKEYIPLLNSENQWNELAENLGLPPEWEYQRTYITKLGSDTIINGINYYKLLTAEDSLSSLWFDNGYIREDIKNRKVYYLPNGKPEMLLYDFDVKVGDKIKSYDLLYWYGDEATITVKEINEVMIDGKLRKQINVRSTVLHDNIYPMNKDHVWIEGVGNMDGFLRSTTAAWLVGGERMSLLCFLENNKLLYKPDSTGIADCFIWKYRMSPLNNQNY